MDPTIGCFTVLHLGPGFTYVKKKYVTCINSFIGGVTNTAQYQNRLMVYDPKQVGICVVCISLLSFV